MPSPISSARVAIEPAVQPPAHSAATPPTTPELTPATPAPSDPETAMAAPPLHPAQPSTPEQDLALQSPPAATTTALTAQVSEVADAPSHPGPDGTGTGTPAAARATPPPANAATGGQGLSLNSVTQGLGLAGGYAGSVAQTNSATLKTLEHLGHIPKATAAASLSISSTGLASTGVGVFSTLAGYLSKAMRFSSAREVMKAQQPNTAAFDAHVAQVVAARKESEESSAALQTLQTRHNALTGIGQPTPIAHAVALANATAASQLDIPLEAAENAAERAQNTLAASRAALRGLPMTAESTAWLKSERHQAASSRSGFAIDTATTANGLLSASVRTAGVAATWGAHVAGNFATAITPGFGIACGAVGLIATTKASYHDLRAAMSASTQFKRVQEAAKDIDTQDQSLNDALDSIGQHANIHLGRAKTQSKWKLLSSVLSMAANALSVVSSASTLSGIGVLPGLLLGAVSAGVSTLSFACAVRQTAYTRAQAKEVDALKSAVATPGDLSQTLLALQQPPAAHTPAQAHAHLLGANRVYSTMHLAERLGAINTPETHQGAIDFLARAGMPEAKIHAILASTQGQTMASGLNPEHEGVKALAQFFGLF